MIKNEAQFARQHIVIRVVHDKCRNLLVNAGELVCMLKGNI